MRASPLNSLNLNEFSADFVIFDVGIVEKTKYAFSYVEII
jgi:hypothetical protein